jgi:6-phosphogluconolactonase
MPAISRRDFVQGAAALSLAAHGWSAMATATGKGELILMGTQTSGTSKGIYAYRFDPATGDLAQIGLAAEAENPTFLALAPGGKAVYATNELEKYRDEKGGAVTSFSLDKDAAKLTVLNQEPTHGGAPCHVAVDHTGRCVFVANYSGGSTASYHVEADGRLSAPVSFIQFTGSGPDKERQEAPHAHRVTVSPDNRFVLVNDLGTDQIRIYHLDSATATLTPNEPATWKATSGSGPRALQFHPNGKWAYCVTEMKSTVNVLHWTASAGTLETVQELPLTPEGYSGQTAGDDIVFDREGRFAYVANRLNDFLATFSVSPADGKLTLLERSSCGGTVPRHIAIDPSGRWLLVANQTSDNVAIFARDAKTGKLAKEGKSFPLSRPQCIIFV